MNLRRGRSGGVVDLGLWRHANSVSVGAGKSFFATEPQANHLRLSWGGANHDELIESVRRLGSAAQSIQSS